MLLQHTTLSFGEWLDKNTGMILMTKIYINEILNCTTGLAEEFVTKNGLLKKKNLIIVHNNVNTYHLTSLSHFFIIAVLRATATCWL